MIELKRSSASKAADLAKLRADGVAEITRITDFARRKFVTAITGQDMIYLEKQREAKEYLASPTAGLSLYPFLSADMAATGLTANEVAQIVLYKADAWRNIGANIEKLRLTALAVIEAATKADDIDAIGREYSRAVDAI